MQLDMIHRKGTQTNIMQEMSRTEEKIRRDKSGQNETRQDKTRQDKTK